MAMPRYTMNGETRPESRRAQRRKMRCCLAQHDVNLSPRLTVLCTHPVQVDATEKCIESRYMQFILS